MHNAKKEIPFAKKMLEMIVNPSIRIITHATD